MKRILGRARVETIVLGAILTLAAILRFYRLDFDLPDSPWVDSFKFVDHARLMLKAGSFRPWDFQYPGLYVNLLALLYRVLAIHSDYGRLLIGGAVAAAFGTALVAATWAASRKVCGPEGSALAAALCAVCTLCVTYSRIPATDCILAFFMAVFMATLAELPRGWAPYALAGALVGLAVGTKWTGLYLLPFLAWAALWSGYREHDLRAAYGRLALGAVCAFAAFLVTTPWFLIYWKSYLQRLISESSYIKYGTVGEVHLGYFDYLFSRTPAWETPWLGSSLRANLGPLGLGLGFLACLTAAASGRGCGPVFYASYVLLYIACVSRPGHTRAVRYLLPALPLIFALIGWFVEEFILARIKKGRVLVLLGCFLPIALRPVASTWRYMERLNRSSTNAEARAWFKVHAPPGSGVFLSPFYTLDMLSLPMRYRIFPNMGGRIHGLPPGQGPSPERNPIYYPELVDELRSAGVHYVVLNSYFEGAFSDIPENRRWFPRSVEAYRGFRERLDREAAVIYSIRGEAQGRFGPDITIYRFKSP